VTARESTWCPSRAWRPLHAATGAPGNAANPPARAVAQRRHPTRGTCGQFTPVLLPPRDPAAKPPAISGFPRRSPGRKPTAKERNTCRFSFATTTSIRRSKR
jgi:hypothetical protein